MQLALTPEEAAFRDELRTFYRTEIPEDIRARHAKGGELLKDDIVTTHKILHKHGLAVPNWPVEWGGKDWTPTQHQIWLDEMQLACVPEPLTFNAKMIGPVIAEFASQEMKERFLPATAALDIFWCQGFSEPEAGSDLASLRTTAVRDGDTYVVNGQKTWTTLGQYADWIFCLVRTDPQAPKRQAGISMLLIDLDTPGITMRPIKLVDGSVEVNEVFFEDVRVPADQLVGEENQGWTYAKFLLGNERTGITGVARTKVRLAQAKERAAANGLLNDPLFAARLAEAENDVLALELTQMRVTSDSSDGKPNPASSVLKLRGTQLQQLATELLVEVAGADALPYEAEGIASPEWAQLTAPQYLNYRKTSIYGGSNEVQRTIISSTILGL
ncbi:acyl-CoA dehydrogenase family protein [Mycolicibacterium smegmatis]|jgi:alkylation response protein AidB-like acyl-CoA dehydrogenase|uniref:Acyl-CoA dehydrogenase domain protein n=1 Tax=Mycolicibacterium smegmatis (strain MKD8) TaxID=1214915 RepID=A0A2U9PZU3_MYCSE|nr:acyl-CoA dehydrogenase family protein [Mycolicibacterium smegmatis]AWT57326.1 acyl-CoA dehydrogenase domain protein [Mycolicibacterium smegmatis MKD8]MCP2621710.1 acyl-CoA dehydrogenase family protein [Mycolicibacterium smegmatis]MDF1901505.1 acyl-CoA dehydrogenase family protein [Mycolicibacterium smegmatis]MDF1907768.1 acyl-CoA dehydrogenase family protein [Mycolicibacterium smegmatis]MDF1918062.1 acyl-CoA dehydrogenase family protein [Mycolicibacterium smegmatis]